MNRPLRIPPRRRRRGGITETIWDTSIASMESFGAMLLIMETMKARLASSVLSDRARAPPRGNGAFWLDYVTADEACRPGPARLPPVGSNETTGESRGGVIGKRPIWQGLRGELDGARFASTAQQLLFPQWLCILARGAVP